MPWLSLVIWSWFPRARGMMETVVQVIAELIQLILMCGGKSQEPISATQWLWMVHGGRPSKEQMLPGHVEKPECHRGWMAMLNTARCPNAAGRNSATLTCHPHGGQEKPARGGELPLVRKLAGKWRLSLVRFSFFNYLTWKPGLHLQNTCTWKIRSKFSHPGHFNISCRLGSHPSTELKPNCKQKNPLTNVSFPVEQIFHFRMY